MEINKLEMAGNLSASKTEDTAKEESLSKAAAELAEAEEVLKYERRERKKENDAAKAQLEELQKLVLQRETELQAANVAKEVAEEEYKSMEEQLEEAFVDMETQQNEWEELLLEEADQVALEVLDRDTRILRYEGRLRGRRRRRRF